MRGTRVAVSVSFAFLLANGLLAQSSPSDQEPTYGPTSEIAHVMHGFDFDVFNGTMLAAMNEGGRVCNPSCTLAAGLRLPAGSLVSRIEVEACESNPAATLSFALLRRPSPAGPFTNVSGFGESGIPATPGCAFFNKDLPTPMTIDNENNTYFVSYNQEAGMVLHAARVYYKLQVTPAPAVATFPNDVPTGHPFFRFVEALAAAGITAGCAPGSFCPGNPVTRGEMAVFLAAALGLHFAP
jgi:hypothetical protein